MPVTSRFLMAVAAGAILFGGCGADQVATPATSLPTVPTHAAPAGRVHPNAGTDGLETIPIRSDRLHREFLLYVPPGNTRAHRLPLVLVYHGADADAQDAVVQSNVLTADEHNHNRILVYPQGYEDSWNDDAGNPPAEAAHINDIAFTRAVLRWVESRYYVNMDRVVATGLSNGAILDELLGCRIAPNFTAILPVEGQIATTFTNNCRPTRPITVFEIHATADPAIPYWGGTFQGDGGPVSVLSAPASAKRWAQLNHCSIGSAKQVSSSLGGGSTLTEYKGCRGKISVTLETIHGGGHQFPSDFQTTLSRVIASIPNQRKAVEP